MHPSNAPDPGGSRAFFECIETEGLDLTQSTLAVSPAYRCRVVTHASIPL
jgi:hypothetical protein